MHKDIARLRPANAITNHRVPDAAALPRRESLERSFHEKHLLVAEVHRLAHRGEIGRTYRLVETEHGWRAEVVRIQDRRRWNPWRWVAILAAASAFLYAATLAARAIAPLLGMLVAMLGLWAAILFLAWLVQRGRGSVTVTQSQSTTFRR